MVTKNPIKRISVHFNLGEGVVISADIESRSREGLMHYTRIILDPSTLEVIRATCSCEGYTFRMKCWHIESIREMTKEELKEEIDKVRNEMLKFEEQTLAEWG